MNNIEKAIHILKEELADGTGLYLTFATAIAALEKQIPKKPMLMQLAEPEYMCECGMKYWRKGGVKYCIECGQKLNWSEDTK